jgi:predicted acetyltransferase
MSIQIRTIRDDEIQEFRDHLSTAFVLGDRDDDPNGADRFRALVDRSQAWAAYDGVLMVGTAATFDHAIGVPGAGTVRMAGLTMVSVRPTHRRRGILRGLMQHHLDDARARAYPVSGLWASEMTIYGRFGYGLAAEQHAMQIEDARALRVTYDGELDTIEWIDEARARTALPPIYARATANRPGALRRSEAWWRERRFLEAPFVRDGASLRRHVLAVRAGEPVGYVQYRQRGDWEAGLPTGSVEIQELVGVDRRADATLWAYILGVDLFPKVTWSNAPVDDLLPWLISDPRRVRRRRTDNLWLRPEDIAAALTARRYPADGVLRLGVDGATWQLAAEAGRATVTATDGAADLRMDRAALGSLYLGGFGAGVLARAGRIHGPDAAVATAERMFASAIAPWCPEVF